MNRKQWVLASILQVKSSQLFSMFTAVSFTYSRIIASATMNSPNAVCKAFDEALCVEELAN